MPSKSKPEWETKFMSNKWVFFVFGLVFLAIAYGFASWAIDSGNLIHYALAIVFIVWGAKEFKRGIHNLRSK